MYRLLKKGHLLFGFWLVLATNGFTQTPMPIHKGSIIDGLGGALLNSPISVFVSGNYAYVASTNSMALEIVDITNPSSPSHKGSLTNGSGGALLNLPWGVYVSGNYAYLVSTNSNALEIVDVSNPASPFHKGSLTNGTGGALLNAPQSVFVSGNYAYIASVNSNALEIVDVTNAAAPVHKGSITNGTGGALINNPWSVHVQGSYAYMASANSNALEIVNITNPAVPVHAGSLTDGSGGALLNYPTSVFVSGSYAYLVGSGNTFEVVDISNPAAPVHKGGLAHGTGGALLNSPWSVYVSGNFAYVASAGSDALEIIDVSNPAAPIHAGSLVNGTGGALLDGPLSVKVSGNYAYVSSSGSNSLEVVQLLPLSITSFSPSSGPIGTSVTITGTSFSTIPTSNIVYFGATRASVVSATTTELVVTAPSGATYQPITVTVNGLTAYSDKPFVATFPSSNIVQVHSFAPKVDLGSGVTPFSAAISDLDGDGRSDLASVNITGNTVSVYRNTSVPGTISASSFASKVDYNTGPSPLAVAVSDIDGDGKQDMIVANQLGPSISIYRNISTPGSINSGSFAARIDIAVGVIGSSVPNSVSIGDMDLDGKPDIVVGNNLGSSISVLRNTSTIGAVSFAPKVDFVTGLTPVDIAIRDFDGDHKPDLAVVNFGNSTVSILKNTTTTGSIGASSFASGVDFNAPSGPYSIAVGDIDGDGKSDLAITSGTDNVISVLRNTTVSGVINSSSFSARVNFPTGPGARWVSVGDLSGDGKLDLTVANADTPSVSVFKNVSSVGIISTSSLSTKVDLPTSAGAVSVVTGDFDGDGRPDLAAVNQGSNSISILRNLVSYPVPSITSFSPAFGPTGASVTIIGNNFGSSTLENVVFFGATKAVVTAATPSQLNVTVPAGATHRPISVMTNGLIAYSDEKFISTFSGGGNFSSSSFAAKVDFSTGNTPLTVELGDIDLDGKADLITANSGSQDISAIKNLSTAGSLTAQTKVTFQNFGPGTSPQSAILEDVNRDGFLDIITSLQSINSFSVLKNEALINSITTSSFLSFENFTTGSSPQNQAIRDLNRDGRPDVVTVDYASNSISIHWNIGESPIFNQSIFAPKISLTTGLNPVCVSICDLDSDGLPDLVVANLMSNTMSIFKNTSAVGDIATSFAAKVDFATGLRPIAVTISDLNGDNKPEIVVANLDSETVSVYENGTTTGVINLTSFQNQVDFLTGAKPTGVAIADLNGDTKLDMVVSNVNDFTVSLFRNTGSASITNSSFINEISFPTGNNPQSVAVGDIDGDGRPDIITPNYSANTISIIRNLMLPGPTILNFSPASGIIGTSVIINGTNFDPTPANNSVKFNSNSAVVSSSTATSISAIVPAGATTGAITVTVNSITATSASSFIVLSTPTITGFNPANGLVGTSVTITGTGFDATPTNNSVKFNGTTAAVVSCTSTSIITSVPVGATTGLITVTVSGQTATSSSNFIVILPVVVSITNESFPATYDRGGALTISITVSDVTNVSLVNLKTRGISEPLSAQKTIAIPGIGTKFEKTISSTDLTDLIGQSYFFEVTVNGQGVLQSTKGRSRIKYRSSSSEQVIPNLIFGNQVKNYQIISIPLELTNKNGNSVFAALGPPDKTKWRLFDYLGDDYIEYPSGFTSINSGKGYWLIVRNSTTINPGEGITVAADDTNPFTISLSTGWNLIGNPYNFRISWQEVLSQNGNPAGVGKLKVFSNGILQESNLLDKYRGGFVFADVPFLLKIPVLRNTSLGGRIGEVNIAANSIDQHQWDVNLTLSSGELSNQLGGIGMDPSGKVMGKDQFDEVSFPLPRGFGLFDMSVSHPEVNGRFSKDVVPTLDNYTWTFDIDHGEGGGGLMLSWRNDFFGTNDKELMLFNPSTQVVADMRKTDFSVLGPETSQIRILYGNERYIQHVLDKELPWLGNAYPNPADVEITIPFRVPESYDQMPVMITIYNSQGIVVGTPVNKSLGKGRYEVTWNLQGQIGLHIIRMRIGQDETKAMKVVFK